MRSNSRVVLSALFALLLIVTSGFVRAGPNLLPPNSNAFGKGYAQLAADWLEWAVAIPAPSNPLLDVDGAFAAVGQSGKVWFLAGNVTGGSTTRTVTVPAGTALFFPIVNYFWVNTPEYGDDPWSPAQEAFARGFVAAQVDTADNVVIEIDGRAVPNTSVLRVASAVGTCIIPDDNIFGIPFAPVPHECVADGYWALLSPLSDGNHTIHFAGGIASQNFSLDVTYNITVRGR